MSRYRFCDSILHSLYFFVFVSLLRLLLFRSFFHFSSFIYFSCLPSFLCLSQKLSVFTSHFFSNTYSPTLYIFTFQSSSQKSLIILDIITRRIHVMSKSENLFSHQLIRIYLLVFWFVFCCCFFRFWVVFLFFDLVVRNE